MGGRVVKCPYCGSKNTAKILYGFPAFDEKLQSELASGKVALGGCCISEIQVNGKIVNLKPARKCNNCQKEFGTPPMLFKGTNGEVEDYREVVTKISFFVGGFFGGQTMITIVKDDRGAEVSYGTMDDTDEYRISVDQWKHILDKLYEKMYLHEWKKSYVDEQVLDGTQWELKLTLTDKRRRNYYGSNMYPPYWKELEKLFASIKKMNRENVF